MPLFSWNDEYSVSVNLFDEHHKVLIGLINELHEAMQIGKGKEALGTIFDKLISYTRDHFQAEEALMVKLSYPDYLIHKNEHENLTRTALGLQAKFNSGQEALSIATIHFLKEWLTHHILMTDMKYGPYLNKMGAK